MGAVEDKLAIQEVLWRYCRAMDRMDAPLALGCFEPDAELVYSTLYRGGPEGFVAWLWPVHARMVGHVHSVSNILVELGPAATAASEAYVQVTLRMELDGELVDLIGKGRYLDRWRRAPEGWRISRRTYVSDLGSVVPVGRRDVSAVLSPATPGLTAVAARRDASDPSYDVLGLVG